MCEDYNEAKEVIFSCLENKVDNFTIEEKNLFFEKKNIQKFESKRSEDLENIKHNLSNLKNQLVQISKKVDNYKGNFSDENFIITLEKKLDEIKHSNESYLKEFQTRINSLTESQENLMDILLQLKSQVQNVQNEISEIKQMTPTDQNIKKINGFYIFNCPKCEQPLRVKQWGKHLCPTCNTKLNILPDGSIKIFDSL